MSKTPPTPSQSLRGLNDGTVNVDKSARCDFSKGSQLPDRVKSKALLGLQANTHSGLVSLVRFLARRAAERTWKAMQQAGDTPTAQKEDRP